MRGKDAEKKSVVIGRPSSGISHLRSQQNVPDFFSLANGPPPSSHLACAAPGGFGVRYSGSCVCGLRLRTLFWAPPPYGILLVSSTDAVEFWGQRYKHKAWTTRRRQTQVRMGGVQGVTDPIWRYVTEMSRFFHCISSVHYSMYAFVFDGVNCRFNFFLYFLWKQESMHIISMPFSMQKMQW